MQSNSAKTLTRLLPSKRAVQPSHLHCFRVLVPWSHSNLLRNRYHTLQEYPHEDNSSALSSASHCAARFSNFKNHIRTSTRHIGVFLDTLPYSPPIKGTSPGALSTCTSMSTWKPRCKHKREPLVPKVFSHTFALSWLACDFLVNDVRIWGKMKVSL